jgi:hypothetical protein
MTNFCRLEKMSCVSVLIHDHSYFTSVAVGVQASSSTVSSLVSNAMIFLQDDIDLFGNCCKTLNSEHLERIELIEYYQIISNDLDQYSFTPPYGMVHGITSRMVQVHLDSVKKHVVDGFLNDSKILDLDCDPNLPLKEICLNSHFEGGRWTISFQSPCKASFLVKTFVLGKPIPGTPVKLCSDFELPRRSIRSLSSNLDTFTTVSRSNFIGSAILSRRLQLVGNWNSYGELSLQTLCVGMPLDISSAFLRIRTNAFEIGVFK